MVCQSKNWGSGLGILLLNVHVKCACSMKLFLKNTPVRPGKDQRLWLWSFTFGKSRIFLVTMSSTWLPVSWGCVLIRKYDLWQTLKGTNDPRFWQNYAKRWQPRFPSREVGGRTETDLVDGSDLVLQPGIPSRRCRWGALQDGGFLRMWVWTWKHPQSLLWTPDHTLTRRQGQGQLEKVRALKGNQITLL